MVRVSATIDAQICAMHSMHASARCVHCRPRTGPNWSQRAKADRKEMWLEWFRQVSCHARMQAALPFVLLLSMQRLLQVKALPEFKKACTDKKKADYLWKHDVCKHRCNRSTLAAH